jgi:hypothetical protein
VGQKRQRDEEQMMAEERPAKHVIIPLREWRDGTKELPPLNYATRSVEIDGFGWVGMSQAPEVVTSIMERMPSVSVVQVPSAHWIKLDSDTALPFPRIDSLVITGGVGQTERLPSVDWVRHHFGRARLMITAVDFGQRRRVISHPLWELLKSVSEMRLSFDTLAITALQGNPLPPNHMVHMFRGQVSRVLVIVNPTPGVVENVQGKECVDGLVMPLPSETHWIPFSISTSLEVMWLDCYFATAYFLGRVIGCSFVTGLPPGVRDVFLALHPFTTAAASVSGIAVIRLFEGFCAHIRARECRPRNLYIKLFVGGERSDGKLTIKTNGDTWRWVTEVLECIRRAIPPIEDDEDPRTKTPLHRVFILPHRPIDDWSDNQLSEPFASRTDVFVVRDPSVIIPRPRDVLDEPQML